MPWSNPPLIEKAMSNIFEEIRTPTNPPVYKCLMNGEWVICESEKTLDVLSPVDGSISGRTQAISQKEADNLIRSAYEAQPGWADTPVWKRSQILHQGARLVEENALEMADVLVQEIGKPKKEAMAEVLRTVELIDYYAEQGVRMIGETVSAEAWPGYKKNKMALMERVPLGVVLAMPPFNYPINEGAPKIVAAIITGNTCVLKPASQGAISALHLAQALNVGGLPPGVLNVSTGKGSVMGDYLLTHPLVACINFTGGTETAEYITQVAGIKKLVFGLSGKDASIVCEDADLDLAASEIASGAFSYAGQRCTAIKRAIVEETVADTFVEKFRDQVTKKFILGDPRDEKYTLGPVISQEVAELVQDLIDDALGKGAQQICGNHSNGLYIEATVLDKVTADMRVAWEEPFGPVFPIIRVKDWKEAVELANRSQYGLQSSVFTQDIDKAFAISQRLEVGTVQINGKDSRGPDHFPFMGVKGSGLGMVQGAKYLLEEMTRIKSTVLNLRS